MRMTLQIFLSSYGVSHAWNYNTSSLVVFEIIETVITPVIPELVVLLWFSHTCYNGDTRHIYRERAIPLTWVAMGKGVS